MGEGKTMRLKKALGSITNKITFLIVCLVLPLNLLVLLATQATINAVQSQMVQSVQESAALYMQQLDNKLNSINTYFYNLNQGGQNFTTFLYQQGDDAYRLARTSIIREAQQDLSLRDSADGYFFYAPLVDDLMVVYEGDYAGLPLPEAIADRQALTGLLQEVDWEQVKGWTISEAGGKSWFVWFNRRGNFYYGAVLSLSHLYAAIMSTIPDSTAQVLLTDAPQSDPGSVIGVWQQSSWPWLWLHIFLSRAEVLRSLPFLQWMALGFAILYLLLIPVLLLILNRILLQPLLGIRRALLKLGSGNQEYRLPEREKRLAKEFNDIHHSFNQMVDRIHSLKIENYEQALQRKDLEVQNLQLQIRPHFLLNTFNLIYNLAQLQDYKSIQKFVLYLTDYFRYLFRDATGLAPFSQELSLIEKYLDVSALRYPDCFTVSYQIDPETERVPVPPLLLHNFVENIFKHAMQVDQDIHIRISSQWTGQEAVFLIEDDGSGIAPETVSRINRGDFDENKNEHVGLRNTCRRLESIYQRKGLMQVESVVGEGTRFVIRIPWERSD